MKGRRIKTLAQLVQAADLRHSVICETFDGCRPIAAAFMQNLQGRMLHRLIEDGMWFYKPKGGSK